MSAAFESAAVTLRSDALRAWEQLTLAQRSALRRCHTNGFMRVRVDTHARTQDALRRMGVLVPLDSDYGKRDISELGAIVRKAGMDSEAARQRKARKGLRRKASR